MPGLRKWSVIGTVLWVSGCLPAANEPGPPEEVRQKLQALLETGLAGSGYLGVVIQIKTPQWTWSSAAGQAQTSPEQAARADMHVRIASVSKAFTATAILMLAEAGQLNLDDPIERWLPAEYLAKIPYYQQITLRLLLNHRSGISDYDEMQIIQQQQAQPDIPLPTDVSIFAGLDQPALFPPDADWMYSNVNYLLLARVIDGAAGMPYETYVAKNILQPLGLNHTFLVTRPSVKNMPEPYMACLYPQDGQTVDYSTLYLNWDRGAGDLISTVADLNAFQQALLSGRLVSAPYLAEMGQGYSTIRIGFLPAVQDAVNQYGLGRETTRSESLNITLSGHEGGYPGATTYWLYWAENDTYLAFNLNGNGKGEGAQILLPLLEYLGGLQAAKTPGRKTNAVLGL